MLLLVTIGLVLIGAISLVIGFVSNSLGPIYLSIACSVIAGIVLVVFSRMARRQESAPAAGVTPAPSPGSWAPASSAPAAPPTAPPPPPADLPTPPARPEPPPRPAPAPRPEPARTVAAPEPARATSTLTAPRPAVDDDFPIEGYDSLRSSEILARLPDLTLDELDMVREREEQGKDRATVIRRVDARIDELESEEDAAADDGAAEPAFGADEFPATGPDEEFPAAGDDEFAATASGDEGAADDDFPIADYDQLSAGEVIAVLDDLDDDELDMVADREERGRNRVEILEYIDDMFEEVEGDEAPPPPAPIVTAPPSRPAAKKAAAKKAPAKKAPAKKALAKKAVVTKAPARKAAAKKAAPATTTPLVGRGAKKAATASPGTKAAGAKATGRKAAAAPATAAPTARRAAKKAAATKVPTKKAAPVRKR